MPSATQAIRLVEYICKCQEHWIIEGNRVAVCRVAPCKNHLWCNMHACGSRDTFRVSERQGDVLVIAQTLLVVLPKGKGADDKTIARVWVVARDSMAEKPFEDSLFEVKSIGQSLQGKWTCSVGCIDENAFNTKCTITPTACACEEVVSYLDVWIPIPELMYVPLSVGVICCMSSEEGVKGV